MTEAQEVAASIWRARSSLDGNGLNTTFPIRSIDDARRVAHHYLPDAGATLLDNVAESLLQKARAAGTVR